MINRKLSFWTVLLVAWVSGSQLSAQVVRLPAVMPPSEAYPVTTASAEYPLAPSSEAYRMAMAVRPDSPALLPQPPLDLPARPGPDRPPDARDGMFQKLIFTYEWLAPDGDAGLGMNDLEVKSVLALPIPSRDWPLLITPGFAVHYLDGPAAPDMPAAVYDAYTQFRSLGRINPRLGAELAVTLGAFSDFEQSNDDAFRITGHGAVQWEWTPTAKLVLGAAYIDTHYADVIPIGGLIWSPNEDLVIEAVFPSPKIARRIYWHGAYSDEVQDWLYLAGEWGNDTWAIRRAAGTDDEVNYRDWRVLLGLERKAIGRPDARLEIGYVFARKLYYKSTDSEFDPTDTVMLRGVLMY